METLNSTSNSPRFSFFDDLPAEVQALGIRRLLRMSGSTFPAYSRLAGHAPPFWSTQAVSDWLAEKLARAERTGVPGLVGEAGLS